MTRRFAYWLFLPLLLWLLSACVKEEPAWDGPVIEISLLTGDELDTRAGADGTQDGIDRYNENLISYVDFFFYPGGATDEDATYHVRQTSGKRRSDVIRLEMDSNIIKEDIFPDSPVDIRTCTVFAVVNYPGTLVGENAPVGTDLSGSSLPELEAFSVNADFVSPENHRQTSFVMTGSVELGLRGRSQVVAATGTINLTRLACKLTVGVDVAESVQIDGTYEVWTPMLDGMEIYLVNGVDNATLGGLLPNDPDYFSYKSNPLRFAYKDLQDQIHFYFEKNGNYYNTYPTYMYPQHWDYGSTESPLKEPFLKLVVPWVRQADPVHNVTPAEKQFYYKIVIPDDRRSGFQRTFVRNNWYHINIVVGILGSETDEAVVPVEGWCYIYDWQDKNVVIKNAEIGSARYLSVERDNYEFRNISSAINLPYTTSHPVVLQNIRVTRPYYGDKTSGDALGGTIRKATAGEIYPKDSYFLEYSPAQQLERNGGNEWLTDTGTGIIFQHTLNNDYEDTYFDYSPYTVSFTLAHADRPDDEQFKRTITIKQYPAIYIESQINSDNTIRSIGGPKGYNYTSDHWGYVYVDGAQHFRPEYDEIATGYDPNWDRTKPNAGLRDMPDLQDLQWRIVNFTGGSRDIFKINISVLPAGTDFVIGDPRKDEVDNLNPVMRTEPPTPVPFCTAPAIEGGERSMTWYYPADPSDRTRNMMAPSYRIASKFGGVEYYDGIPYEESVYRCATYQEDGYPAGRWRLPTRAEIRFIAMLSANNAFTFLFSNGSYYWSANGAIHVVAGDVEDAPTKDYALPRCVYDAWYWGEDDRLELVEGDNNPRSVFTWGDQARR